MSANTDMIVSYQDYAKTTEWISSKFLGKDKTQDKEELPGLLLTLKDEAFFLFFFLTFSLIYKTFN